MAVKHETELYGPIKAFWTNRGYEVKGEVRGCDLVAVRRDEPLPVIVEMKKIFTLPLLLQGLDRQRAGATVWLAVERNRVKKGAHNQRFTEIAAMCRRLSLGLMTVTFYKTKAPVTEVWCDPATSSQRIPASTDATAGLTAEMPQAYVAAAVTPVSGGRKRGMAKLLKEFDARSGDYNVGGSVKLKLITSYRERALQCALALQCSADGQLRLRAITELTSCANAGALLRDNHYGWFRKAERGVYAITPTGLSALHEYREVTSVWASRYPWAANWEAAAAREEGESI